MSSKDGGQAFPFSTHISGSYIPGMSIRDWLAGQALAGMMAYSGKFDDKVKDGEEWALSAYMMADAMLAAREK